MQIFYLGETKMRINKIEICNLYGEYNYSVDFDDKLTFLFGSNGSGKTTVLNILASIITGKIYNLVEYEFNKIIVRYKNKMSKKNNIITIETFFDNTKNYRIIFEGQECIIEEVNELKERLFRISEQESLDKAFFETYPIMLDIHKRFNYVYLPLNRYGINFDDRRDLYYRHRASYLHTNRNPYNGYLNDSLRYISELVRDNCARINVAENQINEKFRQEVLTSSIKVHSQLNFMQICDDLSKSNWKDILKDKKAYIKTLSDIGVWNETLNDHIENFFEDFYNEYKKYMSKDSTISVNILWKYTEFLKIRNIIDLAKDNELKKEEIRKTRETFLSVISRFFENSGSDKKIKISTEGTVYFVNKNGSKVTLANLSSGEKQIIIIFASLIFGLDEGKTGIYIVDEPEASLHLAWQADFVSEILKVNKNVQLIFATHSPELMGKYRENAVMLKRQ